MWQRLRKEAAVAAPKQTVGSSADATPAATAAAAAAAALSPLLPAPDKLPGFTYVSVLLEALRLATTAGMAKPFLSLSVFSAKGQLVETAQVGTEVKIGRRGLPHVWSCAAQCCRALVGATP